MSRAPTWDANSTVFDILFFRSTRPVAGFWFTWLSIFVWMTVSYILAHLLAFFIAISMLRHHQWIIFISSPIIMMAVLGPTTLGALTSASIALTFAMANKAVPMWHCVIIGCSQTLLVILTSFFRILATL